MKPIDVFMPLLLLLAAASSAWPAEGPPLEVFLWKLRPLGLDESTAQRLEDMLRAEMGRLPGISLVEKSRAQQTELPYSGQQLADCTAQAECLSEIGRRLGVAKMVTGVVSALGENFTLDLKLVDVASRREEGRVNQVLGGKEDLLIGAVREALYRLLVPRLYTGSLAVEAAVEGAEVLLDGRLLGRTPLAGPVSGLTPGRHRLQIAREGYRTFEEEVPVRFQQITRVRVDLAGSALMAISYQKEGEATSTLPPRAVVPAGYRAAAWSALGLGAAAAIFAGVAVWRKAELENQLEKASANGELDASYQSVINRGRRWAFWANVGWGTAAGAAASAVLFFILGREPEQPAAVGFMPNGVVLSWFF